MTHFMATSSCIRQHQVLAAGWYMPHCLYYQGPGRGRRSCPVVEQQQWSPSCTTHGLPPDAHTRVFLLLEDALLQTTPQRRSPAAGSSMCGKSVGACHTVEVARGLAGVSTSVQQKQQGSPSCRTWGLPTGAHTRVFLLEDALRATAALSNGRQLLV